MMNRTYPCLLLLIVFCSRVSADERVTFDDGKDQVAIAIDGKPLASYVFRDDKILRPYLADVHAPGGAKVTRNLPPIAGVDATDHDTMHPGIWLAFGDLSGSDFWRNKAKVKHLRFAEPPTAKGDGGQFAVLNQYISGEKAICDELCRLTIRVRPAGTLLIWDSTFSGERPFTFGDQEEMGLGLRVATPLAVKKGGTLLNSDGLKNETQVWGKQADWCDYSGQIDGASVGVLVAPDPENFRRSWFHARDYGFVAANPFGRNAFTKEAKSQVTVAPGESLRLRFAILLHGKLDDPAAAYRDALKVLAETKTEPTR
jgi:hypothetical protein